MCPLDAAPAPPPRIPGAGVSTGYWFILPSQVTVLVRVALIQGNALFKNT